jgi:hypothetical protein
MVLAKDRQIAELKAEAERADGEDKEVGRS